MENKEIRWQCISGSVLKLIAMAAMLVDHVAYFLLQENLHFVTPLFTVGTKGITLYYIFRTIGRIAFPMYCFLLTEGFVHTKNRKRYGTNLLLFALISELPWNFLHSGSLFYGGQNVFFTLFLGFCGLYVIEYLCNRPALEASALIGLLLFAYLFKADYGMLGFAAIVAMYVLREKAAIRAVVCTCIFNSHLRAGVAFVPISLYNGKRGFIRGKVGKYICYAFYPTHMIILAVLKFYILK